MLTLNLSQQHKFAEKARETEFDLGEWASGVRSKESQNM